MESGAPVCPSRSTAINTKLSAHSRTSRTVRGSVCEAVQHAHQKGVIHRDIKPSNILVTLHDGQPVPKVIDFGIAKATNIKLTEKTLFTQFHQFVGTPAYVSPEQIEMSGLDVDTRSDIYSLGVLLYELLTGSTPIDPKTLRKASYGEIQRMIVEDEPARPSHRLSTLARDRMTSIAASRGADPVHLRRQLRGELDWIAMKALDKDRGRRYESAAALAKDIERHCTDQPVEAGPPAASYRLKKLLKRWSRNHAVAGLSVLTLALLIGGATAVVWQWQRAENLAIAESRNRSKAEAAVSEMELQRAEDLFRSDATDEALAYLAKVARKEPYNWQAAERLLSALTFRSFALPTLPPLIHDAAVTAVDWSPDGRFIATASDDKTVRLWEAHTAELLTEPLRHEDKVEFVDISADSRRVLTGAGSTVCLWDTATGQRLTEPISYHRGLVKMSFSGDGTKVVATYRDSTAMLYDGETGEALLDERIPKSWYASLSDDASKLVTAAGSELNVWDANTGERLSGPFRHPQNARGGVAFNPAASRIITGGSRSRGHSWRIQTGRNDTEGHSFEHKDMVEATRFSPDGFLAVTCGRDHIAQLWNVETGQKWLAPLKHRSWVLYAEFSRDGLRLLTFTQANAAYLWDVQTGELITEPIRVPQGVSSAAFHSNGESVVIGCLDGSAYVFDVNPGSALPLQFGQGIFIAEGDPSGRRVATGGSGGQVQIWDAQSGKTLSSKTMAHSKWVLSLEFSPDGQRLVSGSDDGTAIVWDLESEEPLYAPLRHEGRVTRVAFAPDGKRFSTASFDGTARVWTTRTGERAFEKDLKHRLRLWRVRMSADGDMIATGSDDGTARIWNALTGEPLTSYLQHADICRDVSFSPDSRFLATASLDHTAAVWDLSAGGEKHTQVSHGGPVLYVEFSPDSERMVTASLDHTAMIWDVATGRPMSQPMRHDAQVRYASFSPDGERVLTNSPDGTARLWDGRTGKPVSEALRHPAGLGSDRFCSDGDRIVTTAGGSAFLWEVPHLNVPLPPWIIELADSIAGKRLTADNIFEPVAIASLFDLEKRHSRPGQPFSGDYYDRWLVWFFAKRSDRSISALSLVTTRDYVDRLLDRGQKNDLEEVLRLAPARRKEVLPGLARELMASAWKDRPDRLFQAERYLRLARLAEPERDDLWFLTGLVHQRKGETEAAAQAFSRAVPRAPKTPSTCIDLAPHFNASLNDAWLGAGQKGNNLAKLHQGVHRLGGIDVDTRGIVQVFGAGLARTYPRRIAGIAVGKSGKSVHFLHAASLRSGVDFKPGTEIGSYGIRYAQGDENTLPLRIGHEITGWHALDDEAQGLANARLVWSEVNAAGRESRLYLMTWDNPKPDSTIDSIDFVASHPDAAPFLVGLTVD